MLLLFLLNHFSASRCSDLLFLMERQQSRLFVPYKALGEVCSSVPPAFRVLSRKRNESYVVCAVDNVVIQYLCENLRVISVSNALPARISVVAADSHYIYAAIDKRIAVLYLARYLNSSLHFTILFFEIYFELCKIGP